MREKLKISAWFCENENESAWMREIPIGGVRYKILKLYWNWNYVSVT